MRSDRLHGQRLHRSDARISRQPIGISTEKDSRKGGFGGGRGGGTNPECMYVCMHVSMYACIVCMYVYSASGRCGTCGRSRKD